MFWATQSEDFNLLIGDISRKYSLSSKVMDGDVVIGMESKGCGFLIREG